MTISSFSNLIQICNTTSGTGSRAIISSAIANLDEDGQKLCHLALNQYITFGVKQIPEPDFSSSEDASLEIFYNLCSALENRELTGNRAKLAIMDCLIEFTPNTQQLLSSVLRKNLQANFSVKTYNKATKGKKIPEFSVMLADKVEDEEEWDNVIGDGVIADYKYDGVRTIVVARNTGYSFFSREGVEMPYCEGLFDEDLDKILEEYGEFVIDAEQFNGTWETTMNARKGGDSAAKQSLGLKVFFLMPYADWISQNTKITMKQNRDYLEELIPRLGLKKLVLTGAKFLTNLHEIKEMLKEVTTAGFDGIAKGHEGLILKRPDATYSWKRSIDWCKVKNFYDVDMVVLEILPGRPNTKYSNVMGKVRCRGYLEDGTLVEGFIGSGFTDEERANAEQFMNKTIVCSYQEITKPSQKSPIPNLRFGTFVRVRDDKTIYLEE